MYMQFSKRFSVKHFQVMDDMNRMKGTHLKIVGQIQEQYKIIEEDSQGQFNQFVITFRDEYQSKLSTFRKVINIHRADLENNQSDWKNSLEVSTVWVIFN